MTGRALRARLSLIHTFDVIVDAAYTGVLKPDRKPYEDCLAQLGVAAADAVFVDDQWHNIEGARHVGLPAVHFDVLHPADSVQQVAQLLGLAPSD